MSSCLINIFWSPFSHLVRCFWIPTSILAHTAQEGCGRHGMMQLVYYVLSKKPPSRYSSLAWVIPVCNDPVNNCRDIPGINGTSWILGTWSWRWALVNITGDSWLVTPKSWWLAPPLLPYPLKFCIILICYSRIHVSEPNTCHLDLIE